MKNHSKKPLLIILTILTLLLIPLTTSADWEQYTPSPVATDIIKVKTTSQHAMALTSTNQILFYNTSHWKEISPPNLTITPTEYDLAKATDNNFYWYFDNNSNYLEVWKYNPVGQTWTNIQQTQETANSSKFTCIESGAGYDASSTDADCFYTLNNGTNCKLQGTTGSTPSTTPYYTGSGGLFCQTYAGSKLWLINYPSVGQILWFNGVSWNLQITFPFAGTLQAFYSVDELHRIYTKTGIDAANIYVYNQTSSSDNYYTLIPFFTIVPTAIYLDNELQHNLFENKPANTTFYQNQFYTDYAYTMDIDLTHEITTLDTSLDVYSADTDRELGNAWAVGESGLILRNEITNPTQTVTLPETINYAIYNYTASDPTINNIEGVTPITTTKTYAIAKKDGKLAIISYDHNNPNSIITENLTTPDSNTPRGIDALGDTLTLATSGNARIYNNTDPGEVTQLTLKATPQASTFSDDIVSIYYATAYDAYGCDHRLTDEIVRYNTTSGTIINTTGVTCNDLAGTSSGDYIYAHSGLSGLKIYNQELTLINTQTIITSLGANNPTDTLSTFANKLSVVTGRNTIKTYDITTPTSPTFEWECRAAQDITSIEMLTTNIIAIGTLNGLHVCNQEDESLYDTPGNYYIAKQVKSNLNANIVQRDLRRTSTSLTFAAAENTQFSYYQLQIGDLASINRVPSFTSLDVTDNDLCINQTTYISATLEELDDNQIISISYDCGLGETITANTGFLGQKIIQRQFACEYPSPGVKSVKITGKDFQSGQPIALSSNQITTNINVNNCVIGVDVHPMNLLVRDYVTTDPLPNATINIIGYTSLSTDSNGQGYAELPFSGIYNITVSKPEYVTITKIASTGNQRNIIELQPTTITTNGVPVTRTILKTIVQDTSEQPITEALVSATDQLTALSKLASTDSTGSAYLYDLATGTQIRVSAGKEGYQSEFTTTTINPGETKTLTITLLRDGELTNASSGRGCRDYIKGIILCSPLNTSGDGDNCQTDNDCITGRCMNSLGNKQCSQFNYTQCDNIGEDRGNLCYTKVLAMRTGENASNVLLDYFLYFGVIFIFILAIVIIVMAFKRR